MRSNGPQKQVGQNGSSITTIDNQKKGCKGFSTFYCIHHEQRAIGNGIEPV